MTRHIPSNGNQVQVPVEIWYYTKARQLAAGSENGAALPLHMVLDGDGSIVDLRQYGTLTGTSDELPRHLIEAVTELGGYWADEDEQDFWENWVMYPELTKKDSQPAFDAVRRLLQTWVTVTCDATLKSSRHVKLFLKGLSDPDERIQLMDLEIIRIDHTVFTEDIPLDN